MDTVVEEEPNGWRGCFFQCDEPKDVDKGGVPRLLRMQLHGLDYSGCVSEASEFISMSPGSDYPPIGYTNSSVLPLPTTPEQELPER